MKAHLHKLYATFWGGVLLVYALACIAAKFRIFWLTYVALGLIFGLMLFASHILRVRRAYRDELIRERTRQELRERRSAELLRQRHPA